MNCLNCGKELTGKYQKKYCSVPCQKAHRSALIQKKRVRVCETCGKEFIMHRPSGKAKKGEVKEGRFCSRACHFAWVRQQPKKVKARKEMYIGYCPICGKEFESLRKRARCSYECDLEHRRRESYKHNSANKALETRPCKECGIMFIPEYGNKKRYFCSDMCLHRNMKRRRRHKERALIRNVRVETVDAIRVFKRDGWRCQLCGIKLNRRHRGTIRDDAPELDHIIPLSKGGEHSYRNTQCACRKCNQEKGARELGQLRLFG